MFLDIQDDVVFNNYCKDTFCSLSNVCNFCIWIYLDSSLIFSYHNPLHTSKASKTELTQQSCSTLKIDRPS